MVSRLQVFASETTEPGTQLPSCDLLIGEFASVDAQSVLVLNCTSLLLSLELDTAITRAGQFQAMYNSAGECWCRQSEGHV